LRRRIFNGRQPKAAYAPFPAIAGQDYAFPRCIGIRVLAFQTPRQFFVPPLKGREAERRKARTRKPHRRMRPPPPNAPPHHGGHGGGSPLGAPPRRLPRQSRPWLSPGRVSWDVRRQALPAVTLSQSSGAPRRPVIMPAEAMPGPPGSKVTSPARRNRIHPHQSAVTG
jgi:hypothetical protein